MAHSSIRNTISFKHRHKFNHTSDHPLDIIFFAIVGYKDIYWGYYDGRNIFKLTNVTII